MKHLLMATAATALMAGAAFAGGHAKEVKLGVMVGFTGPIESLTPDMAAGRNWRWQKRQKAANLWGAR